MISPRIAAIGLVLMASGCASYAPPPITVQDSLGPSASAKPTAAPFSAVQATCTVQILELTDTRLDPETIGILYNKAVKAPKDRETWLHDMIATLETRGIDVVFPDEAAPKVPSIAIKVNLEKAWLMGVYDAVVSSVLFRVAEPMADGTVSIAQFTGKKRASTIWKLGATQANNALGTAVDEALDSMATHLKKRCASLET